MNLLFNHLIKTGTPIIGKWNKNIYKVKKIIGSGENGTVFLVESDGKEYALKMSLATIDLSNEIQVIQRLQEAQGQPLGFSVFDIDDFKYKGELYTYYVMDYRKGISIDRYLYGKKPYDYITLFKEVVDLLGAFHKNGFVFGDLKTEHILVDQAGRVTFIDLGGVTPIDEGVRQYTEIYDRGSWKAGGRKADSHYDFFSLSMVFIKAVIGRKKLMKIFNGSRSFAAIYDIIHGIPVLKPLLPVLKGILMFELTNVESIKNEIENQLNHYDFKTTILNKWIDWTFASSFVFFISVFAYFIYVW